MTKAYLRDLAERVLTTFSGGALSVLVTNTADLTDLTLWKGAALAGFAAALSLLKGLLARTSGDPETAGL